MYKRQLHSYVTDFLHQETVPGQNVREVHCTMAPTLPLPLLPATTCTHPDFICRAFGIIAAPMYGNAYRNKFGTHHLGAYDQATNL